MAGKFRTSAVASFFKNCTIRKIRQHRDRFRVVILKLNSKEYIDGVLKSKVNFEFLVNLFVSENDRIH